jgi:putative phosphoesterase
MNIALIADMHGNLTAFNAVLDDIAQRDIDQMVCLGDVAALGPQPREVLARLQALGCPIVMGNTDANLLEPKLKETTDEDQRNMQEVSYWCAQQLSASDQDFIRTFQPTIEVALAPDKTLLCFHGSPRSFNEIIVATTPEEELETIFANVSATIMAGGHTHIQMFRRFEDVLLLNPGSIGLPMDGVPPMRRRKNILNAPWAEYAIVHSDGNALDVELLRVPFDVHALLEIARSSGMPHAEWWTRDWRVD